VEVDLSTLFPNDVISIEDITDGVPATNYAHQLQNGAAPEGLTDEQIAARVRSIDAAHAMQTVGPNPIVGATVAEQAQQYFQMQKQSSIASDSLASSQLETNAYAKMLRDTPYEAQLVDAHWTWARAASIRNRRATIPSSRRSRPCDPSTRAACGRCSTT